MVVYAGVDFDFASDLILMVYRVTLGEELDTMLKGMMLDQMNHQIRVYGVVAGELDHRIYCRLI